MSLSEFIEKYYLLPIHAEMGYNFYNTLTYAIMALIVLYAIFKIINKSEIKINFNFFVSLVPFIVFGSLVRALVDKGYFFRTFWVISPGIYILTASLFLFTLTVSYYISKSKLTFLETKDYWRVCATLGTFYVFLIILKVIQRLGFRNSYGFLQIMSVFAFVTLVFIVAFKLFNIKWATSKLAIIALMAHLFDASSTYVVVKYFGGHEKHPLPRWIIEESGAESSFFILKLIVLIPAIYVISTQIEDKELRNFLLISIAVLGFAEGLRNLLSLIII